jgi:hypothetical protein
MAYDKVILALSVYNKIHIFIFFKQAILANILIQQKIQQKISKSQEKYRLISKRFLLLKYPPTYML